jgi:hypothetical protein
VTPGSPRIVKQQNRLTSHITGSPKTVAIELASHNLTRRLENPLEARLDRSNPPGQFSERRVRVSTEIARRNDGDQIELVYARGTGDARLVIPKKAPENGCQTDCGISANAWARAVLVIAKRRVQLALVLAVGDGDDNVEAVGLMSAPKTGRKRWVYERPAGLAYPWPGRGDIPHCALICLACLIDLHRHGERLSGQRKSLGVKAL